MSEQATIPIGTLFRGRYEVKSVLGKGGFGTTYVVLDHERFKRKCVLKELLPKHKGEQKVRELFEREARTLDRLDHPGIPRLEAFFTHEDHYYLIEEFVEGESLAEVLEKRGTLPEAEAVKIADEILEILTYLHGLSPAVIHRDIKPSNLIVSRDGHCKLIDFGAVREALSVTTASEGEATRIGSPGYMAPEQHRGQAFPASDLYALGATLLHLLTGRPPAYWYDARDGRWTYEGHVNASAGLLGVLKKLLAELVPNRYTSAGEVLRDLGKTEIEKKESPVPTSLPLKKMAAIGALAVALIYWYFLPRSIKVQSVQFFGSTCNVQAITAETPPRSNYKRSFRSDEPYICYDLRLTEPAQNDVIIDVAWRQPDHSTKHNSLAIKKGFLGITTSWGEPGKQWLVGPYKVDFSQGSEALASAEFDVTPPPAADSLKTAKRSSWEGDVEPFSFGPLRFYQEYATKRRYDTVFNSNAGFIHCEVTLTGISLFAPERFKIRRKLSVDGNEIGGRGKAEEEFEGDLWHLLNRKCSISCDPGDVRGRVKVELFVETKQIASGSFTVR